MNFTASNSILTSKGLASGSSTISPLGRTYINNVNIYQLWKSIDDCSLSDIYWSHIACIVTPIDVGSRVQSSIDVCEWISVHIIYLWGRRMLSSLKRLKKMLQISLENENISLIRHRVTNSWFGKVFGPWW